MNSYIPGAGFNELHYFTFREVYDQMPYFTIIL